MLEKTLREVCTAKNVSRRAVQGYEKAGLVEATGHNNRGYLLYDEAAQLRIETIKRYQNFGFSVKEIAGIIDAPPDVLKAALEERLVQLRKEHETMETVIRQVREMIEFL